MCSSFSSGIRRAAGLGLLSWIGAAAASSVHAQSLGLGTSIGAPGSATISGSGTTVSGDATFGGGAGPATTAYSTVTAFASASGGSPSSVTLESGGSITSLRVSGSDLTMSGGSVGSLAFDTAGNGSSGGVVASTAFITGGSVSAISAKGGISEEFGAPPTNVFTLCTISGGTFATLASTYNGGYNIDGTNLKLFTNGLVTGTLSDGQALDAQYTNSSFQGTSGFLDFNGVAAVPQAPPAAVPEASTTVSFGLLLTLGLGGLFLAKRRAKIAASSMSGSPVQGR